MKVSLREWKAWDFLQASKHSMNKVNGCLKAIVHVFITDKNCYTCTSAIAKATTDRQQPRIEKVTTYYSFWLKPLNLHLLNCIIVSFKNN